MAKLFVYYPEFEESALNKAKIWGIGAKEMRTASTLKELAEAVGKHKHLEELVLHFHGIPGGITFDEEGYALSDTEVKAAFSKTPTKIDAIRFEGCWVGEAPDEMAAFARIFSAKQASGFTWVSVSANFTVHIKQKTTEEALRKVVKEQERWFARGSASVSQLAQQTGDKKILLEWFQANLLKVSAPYEIANGATTTNFARYGKQKYRLRSEATERSVTAAKAVRNTAEPPPFEYVTVTL